MQPLNYQCEEYFLGLINKHLKNDNTLSKIINKNDVKNVHSCTNNICKIIQNHNKELIDKFYWNNNEKSKQPCKCKIKNECPRGNKYNLNNIIYKATLSTKKNRNEKTYIGITSLNWKFIFNNHLLSFRNPTLKHQNTLSKYYWYLKELGISGRIDTAEWMHFLDAN